MGDIYPDNYDTPWWCRASPIARADDQAATDEATPYKRAEAVIGDLKKGVLPRTLVRDLGEAVRQAERDSSIGRAIRGT